MIPAQLVFNPDTDHVELRVPAAAGDGDVVVLRFPLDTLSETDRHRLRHVRDEEQEQPAAFGDDFRAYRAQQLAVGAALVDEDANHWDAIDALQAQIDDLTT